jgi:hypothetical protein
MKNIHILPTDQPSRLHLWTDENGMRLALCELEYSHTRNTQNLYITSDEEIKGKEWFLDLRDNFLFQNQVAESMSKVLFPNCKKIILTTDPTLIADGVQAIDDEFLEWFVKNPSCEKVKVSELRFFDPDTNKSAHCKWEYDLPQEEPKQEKEEEYFKHLEKDKKEFAEEWEEIRQEFLLFDKERANTITSKGQKTVRELQNTIQQETLEEAAKEFYPPTTTDLICSPKLVRDAFVAGGKHMAERMYSEQIELINWLQQSLTSKKFYSTDAEDLIEQFKKK